MMNKYIVSISHFSKDQEENFIKYLKEHNSGWWHIINNFWLVSSNSPLVTKESIREELKKDFNGTLIVLDTTGSGGWTGFGQTKDFEWMKNNWDV